MTEQEPPVVMVRLPGGAEVPVGTQVPEAFTAVVRFLEKGPRWDIGVVMVDGRPHAQWVMTQSDKPMSPELLRSIDLVAVLDAAVQYMPWQQAIGDQVAAAIDEIGEPDGTERPKESLERGNELPEPAQAARRRRNVTPELLSNVLELYEKGGIQLVTDELSYTERHARRLLARARKEITQ